MAALFIILFTIAANVSLIYVLIRHNRDSLTNRLIALIALTSIFWTFFNYLPYTTEIENTRLIYVRAVMFLTSPFGYLVYLLARTYPNRSLKSRTKLDHILVVMGAMATLIMAALSVTPLVFSEVNNTIEGKFNLVSGDGLVLYAVLGISMMVMGFFVLLRKYFMAKGLEKKQLQFFLSGLIGSFSLMASSNLLAVLIFQNTTFTLLGPTFTLIFIALVTYSIVKHGFLEINTLVVRTIFYLIVLLFLGFAYSAVILIISSIFFQKDVTSSDLFPGVAAAVVTAFSFPHLHKKVNKLTEKIFFKNWYDSEHLLYQIALSMSSTLDMQKLTKNFFALLNDALHFTNAAIIVGDRDSLELYQSSDDWNPLDGELASYIKDVDEKSAKTKLIYYDPARNNWTEQVSIKMHIWLVREDELLAALIFGEKKSGDVYVEKDIEVLSIISSQLALAIRNIRAYQEISNFNLTLKEEVDRATARLKAANRRLKELDALKDEFVSIASHELRTPMVSIRNYVWMVMAGKGGPINAKQREYLRRAYESTTRLTRLVNGMLNISRIEAGRIILTVEQADLRDVITSVIHEVQGRAETEGISIKMQRQVTDAKTGKEATLPTVLIDMEKIKEVLINLIGNSLKFTPKGGEITIECQVQADDVVISVRDSGVGLSDEALTKLFKKFGMMSESYAENAKTPHGTGLGLYISKSVIELHGGEIWATSEGHGKGATFSFTVPRFTDAKLRAFERKQGNSKDAGIIHSDMADYS